RVLAHAEVIIRAPDRDRAGAIRRVPCCVREAPSDPLDIGKHPIAAFLVQAGKRGGKEMIIGHGAKSPSGLRSMIGTSDTRRIRGFFRPMRSARQALAMLSACARQSGTRQGASVRVK